MSAGAELHVLAAKRRDLAVAEAGLNRDEQQRSIPPSDPCARIRSCDKGGGLFLRQKLHRAALVALRRDRQDALALQRAGWFTDRHVLEERMDGGQAVVSRPGAVATVEFEVFEKLPQEGSIEILDEQFGWRPSEVLYGRTGARAGRCPGKPLRCMARAELLQQPIGEEALNEGREAGNAHCSPPG